MALFHPHCIHIHVFVLERFPIILNQHCFTHIRRNHMHLFWSDPGTFFPGAMGPGNASGLVEEMPSPDPHVNPINPHQMFTYDFFDHFRPPKKVSPTWRVPHVPALHLREWEISRALDLWKYPHGILYHLLSSSQSQSSSPNSLLDRGQSSEGLQAHLAAEAQRDGGHRAEVHHWRLLLVLLGASLGTSINGGTPKMDGL